MGLALGGYRGGYQVPGRCLVMGQGNLGSFLEDQEQSNVLDILLCVPGPASGRFLTQLWERLYLNPGGSHWKSRDGEGISPKGRQKSPCDPGKW